MCYKYILEDSIRCICSASHNHLPIMTRHCKIVVHILYFLQSGAYGLFHRKMVNLSYVVVQNYMVYYLDFSTFNKYNAKIFFGLYHFQQLHYLIFSVIILPYYFHVVNFSSSYVYLGQKHRVLWFSLPNGSSCTTDRTICVSLILIAICKLNISQLKKEYINHCSTSSNQISCIFSIF